MQKLQPTKLPKIFRPIYEAELCRVGKKRDGGYVIPKKALEQTDTLISFGLYNDWSFEKDFTRNNQAKIFCYDHTVTNKFWVEGFWLSALQLLWFEVSLGSLWKYFSYKRFFNKKRATHFKQKIGPKTLGGKTLKEVLETHKGKNVFLKIDIEGWEYRIMEDLKNLPSHINGLAIEFHDVDLHQERIIDFLKKVPLKLVHIHVNNFSSFDESHGPLAIEMSFAREDLCKGKIKKHKRYPIEGLDYPNSSRHPDAMVEFA